MFFLVINFDKGFYFGVELVLKYFWFGFNFFYEMGLKIREMLMKFNFSVYMILKDI